MFLVREPTLHPVPITDLRPTQMTVGMQEVAAKRALWHKERGEKAADFLDQHLIPVIIGPKQHRYVIDHHHLALALHLEGVKGVLVTIVADLSMLGRDAFWFVLDNKSWTHPYDADGTRQPFDKMPKTVTELADDPYRSLAGALRRAGGYAKDTTPFSEFLWADFLRRRIKRKTLDKDFEQTVKKALILAKSPDADYLPGWCGPSAH